MPLKKTFSVPHAFKIIYLLSTVLLVNVGYIFSFLIMLGGLPTRNFQTYTALMPYISISTFLLADFLQLPRFFRKKNLEVVSECIQFAIVQTLITASLAYMVLPSFVNEARNAFPRSVLVISAPVLFVLIAAWSALGMRVSRRLYNRGRLVILGTETEEMNTLEAKITSDLVTLDLTLAGKLICDEDSNLGDLLASYSEIMICPSLSDKLKSEIIHYCARENIVAYLVPQFYEIALFESKIIHLNDLLVFMIDRMKLTFEQRFVKRIFDLLVSLLALILASPFLLISAILIKASSKGPILFKQERVTLDNKKFKIYKLRTMKQDAEVKTGPVISGKNDPRVTPIGRFLRRSKLDEVPQFINVLMGDMSVVGPRSERPEFTEQFEQEIPAYAERFSVKAGITGLAQVAGSYDTTPEDKLRYDLLYIKNYSLLQDLKIIAQTIRTIFTPHLYNKTFSENMENTNSKEQP